MIPRMSGSDSLDELLRRLFCKRMVVGAERAGDLPHSIFVLPECDELRFPNIRGITRMMEAMDANLHCPVVRYRIDLQRTGHQFPRHFPANVFLQAIQK